MTRAQGAVHRGFFAIGIANTKTPANIGTLWRSASLYGAAFVFTVGARYNKQCTDTMRTPFHTPLFHFANMDDLVEHLPYSCPLVGIEMAPEAKALANYAHPERAAYLLGAEDHGLSPAQVERCHDLVQIECPVPYSMNVAVAGSLVLHNRYTSPRRQPVKAEVLA